jgi:phosphatidylserine/phosphatidylglycerophosphate/cardiolipin synthase-like enzyme
VLRFAGRLTSSVAVLLLAALASPALVPVHASGSPRAAVRFRTGAVFNDPVAGGAPAGRVIRRIEKAIDATPRGAVIRIATYTFQLQSTADALAAASRRGVRVRVVVDGKHTPPGPLVAGMRKAGVRVVRADGAARSAGGGSMHVKLYLFSRTGASSDVVMTGSTNLAEGSVERMWTDLFTVVGNTALYDGYVRFHSELMRDEPVADPYRRFGSGRFSARAFPRPGRDRTTDDIWEALATVEPAGAVIRVSMYAWEGVRGEYLAERLAALRGDGADVAVLRNGMSATVRQILVDGGVTVYDSRLDPDGDGVKDYYVHHKYLLVGQPASGTWQTWTGSANWGFNSLRRGDDTVLRIAGRGTFDQYLRNFDDVRSAA